MLLLPDEPGKISPDWLGHVLDAPVAACRVADAHAGTTGRAVLEVEYRRRASLPARLFVKLPPGDRLQREFVRSSGMGRREVLFYRTLSQEVPVRVPRCYFADCDDSGDEYFMLLEHLEDSGCTFRNARSRYSVEYVREVLSAFAALHSAYWDTARFATDLAWLQPPLQHDIAVQLVARALAQHGADMPAVFSRMGELYLAETDAIHRLWQAGSATLIHGDVHDGNMFYDRDRPGFLDWAVVARGPAMRDTAYFLAGTLTAGDQVEHGAALLAFYREQLLAAGVAAPPAAELWQQYQWHAGYVWLGAAVTLAMGDAWQPVNYLRASLQRLHAAMDHIGCVEAIRAAL